MHILEKKCMLEVKDISVSYGATTVLSDISFTVKENEIVAIIGPNGHGKTTLLKSIAGVNPPTAGDIKYYDEKISNYSIHHIVQKGIILLPEGGGYISNFTVLENLKLGAFASDEDFQTNLEKVYKIFPWLEERKNQISWSLSGGERRMLAIARTLMTKSNLLLLDELTMGIAPIIQLELKKVLKDIQKLGYSLLITESNIPFVLDFSDRFYLLKNNKIIELQEEEIRKDSLTLFI
jgi:branched-chain amino acid transport system ATP-binding protein